MNFDNMKVYSKTGTEIIEIVHSSADYHEAQLMEKDEIYLEFNTGSLIDIGIGCYVVYRGVKYFIRDKVVPEVCGNGYKYSVVFCAYYFTIDNYYACFDYSMTYDGYGIREFEFSFTGTLSEHLNIIERGCAYYRLGLDINTPFTIIIPNYANVPKYALLKNIKYENLTILGALNLICETYECEWWILGRYIYIGICMSEQVSDRLRHEIEFINFTINNTEEEIYDGYYVFGSTKNLPKTYQTGSSSKVVSCNVNKRLCLPNSIKSNFLTLTMSTILPREYKRGIKIYDDIFPSHTSTIDLVLTGKGTEKNESTGLSSSFTTFIIRDKYELGLKESDIISSEILQIKFQTGLLAGLIFDVHFYSNYQENGIMYEIIRNNNYGDFYPNDIVNPKEGDEFILFNFSCDTLDRIDFNNGKIYRVNQLFFSSQVGTYFLTDNQLEFENVTIPEGMNVGIEFVSGNLNNMIFKVFLKTSVTGSGNILNYPYVLLEYQDRYGRYYPINGDVNIGDEFRLFFYNNKVSIDGGVFDEMVQEAETRLLDAYKKDAEQLLLYGNIANFTIDMNPVYVNGYSPVSNNLLEMKDGILHTVDGYCVKIEKSDSESEWIKEHERIDYCLGDNVEVNIPTISDRAFPTRIIGYKKMLDECGLDSYTCGIRRGVTRLKSIENRLNILENGR